jgi:hypothetical protein
MKRSTVRFSTLYFLCQRELVAERMSVLSKSSPLNKSARRWFLAAA